MKLNNFFLVALSLSLLFSCSKSDDEIITPIIPVEYENGVFILNEGASGQGSVSFLSNDLSKFTQDVYGSANGSDLFGKYVQSIFFNGDNAYIIAGGSNKINVVNRKTFKLVAKIETGLKRPRYGVVKDGKAYITNAGNYSSENPNGNTDDYIAVINLATNLVESNITINATASRILLENGKLYITEPYNNDKVLVVNTTTNTLETPINIGLDGDTMEVKDGVLYVLQGGYPGKISKIKLADKSITEVNFPTELDGAKNLDIYEDKIFYTVDASIYVMNLTATTAATTPLFTYISTSEYGKSYGFAVRNNRIFIADGGDFTANSKAYIYSLTGTLQKELTVGVGPNGFYFN